MSERINGAWCKDCENDPFHRVYEHRVKHQTPRTTFDEAEELNEKLNEEIEEIYTKSFSQELAELTETLKKTKKINPIYELKPGFDLIDAAWEQGELVGFARWLVIKYVKRAGLKIEADKTINQSLISDLEKAQDVLGRWLDYVKGESNAV